MAVGGGEHCSIGYGRKDEDCSAAVYIGGRVKTALSGKSASTATAEGGEATSEVDAIVIEEAANHTFVNGLGIW